MTFLRKLLEMTDAIVRKFMNRKEISGSRSKDNVAGERLRSEFEPAQTKMKATNVAVDRPSPIQAQLSAFHLDGDTGLYCAPIQ